MHEEGERGAAAQSHERDSSGEDGKIAGTGSDLEKWKGFRRQWKRSILCLLSASLLPILQYE